MSPSKQCALVLGFQEAAKTELWTERPGPSSEAAELTQPMPKRNKTETKKKKERKERKEKMEGGMNDSSKFAVTIMGREKTPSKQTIRVEFNFRYYITIPTGFQLIHSG